MIKINPSRCLFMIAKMAAHGHYVKVSDGPILGLAAR